MVSWDIVTTAREPTAVLVAFVAYHLQQGVSKIWLCLDGPDPELEALLSGDPRVQVTLCDNEYWRNMHGTDRPEDFRIRQVKNANWAYEKSKSEWLAHIDSDEFIAYTPQLMSFLSEQPEDIWSVVMWNAERVLIRGLPVRHIYGGYFRAPFQKRRTSLMTKVYGIDVRYLNFGVAGYQNGKAISRVGKPLEIMLHRGELKDSEQKRSIQTNFHRLCLLHFDGFTQKHWTNKMLLKAPGGKALKRPNKARLNQVLDTWDARKDEKLQRAIYTVTKTLNLWQAFLLLKSRKLLPWRYKILGSVAAEFPDLKMDFSPAAIDQELAKLKAQGDVFAVTATCKAVARKKYDDNVVQGARSS